MIWAIFFIAFIFFGVIAIDVYTEFKQKKKECEINEHRRND